MLSTIGNWWIFSARKHFCQLLNLLREVDENLQSLGKSTDFKRQKLVAMIVTTLSCFFTVLIVSFSSSIYDVLNHTKIDFLKSLTFSMCVERWILLNLQIIVWIWLIKLRFEKLNDVLEMNFLKRENRPEKNSNALLSTTAELHDELVDACGSFCKCYGFPVSLICID
jgi:hypothetical protein